MNCDQILAQLEHLVAPILDPIGFELVERELVHEYGRWVLRIYIDREGSPVTIGDCEQVSRSLAALLDVEDLIPASYALEVSSPGIERPLRKPKDFERFAGELVEVKTRTTVEGRHNFLGTLKGLQGDEIVIQEPNREYRIPLGQLKKARLRRMNV